MKYLPQTIIYLFLGTAFTWTELTFAQTQSFRKPFIFQPSPEELFSEGAQRITDGGPWLAKSAVPFFDQAIQKKPDYAQAYFQRGRARYYMATIAQSNDESNDDSSTPNRVRLRERILKAAIADFNQAIRFAPDNALAYYYRGLTQFRLEDKKSALADVAQALTLNPDLSVAYFLRGEIQTQFGRYDLATEDYLQVLRTSCCRFNRREQKNYERAIQAYNQLSQENPNFVYHYYRFLAYQDVGENTSIYDFGDPSLVSNDTKKQFQEVIRLNSKFADAYYYHGDYSNAIELNPQLADAYFERARNYFQELSQETQDRLKALHDYNQAIRLKPNFVEAYYRRGLLRSMMYDNKGAIRDLSLAFELNSSKLLSYLRTQYINLPLQVKYYLQTLQNKPTSAEAYFYRGVARVDLHDFVGANRDFTEAIHLSPKFVEAYYNRALRGWQEYCDPAMLDDFTQAIRLNPNFSAAYYQRGKLLLYCDNWLAAVKDFDQVLRLNPNDAEAYYASGWALAYGNANKLSIENLLKAVRIAPNSFDNAVELDDPLIRNLPEKSINNNQTDVRNIDLIFREGSSRLAQGDAQGAISDFTQLIMQNPKDIDALYSRAQAYYRLKSYSEAVLDLSIAFELKPDNADIVFLRALIQYDAGNLQAALEDSTKAIQLNPSSGNAFFLRSLILHALGDKFNAKKGFNRVFSLLWVYLGPPYLGGGEITSTDAITYYNRGIFLARRGDKQGAVNTLRKAADIFQAQGNQTRYQETLKRVAEIER